MAELLARAMVDDDMKEDYVSPVVLDSLKTSLREDALSPEDLAWADSCLNKDADASDSDWNSIKDALLDILSSQRGPVDSTAIENGAQSISDENHVSRENLTSLEFVGESHEDEDLLNIESIKISDEDEDSLILGHRKDMAEAKSRIENAFRPNFVDILDVENDNSGMNPSLTTWEVESSSDDIFKVWELGVTDEQDDFTKQLNKVLADVPPVTLLNTGGSTTWEDVMHDSVDDLIAGIADLSLKQTTN